MSLLLICLLGSIIHLSHSSVRLEWEHKHGMGVLLMIPDKYSLDEIRGNAEFDFINTYQLHS